MGGGLMQLVAYGAQDVYLTGNPQITFFKVVYRRHTNFSMEAIEQTFNGTADFGKKVSATISRNGDLVTNMYVEIGLPASGDANKSYNDNAGFAVIKSVELEIGGQRIDKHYGEWMHLWSELTLASGKNDALEAMVDNGTANTAKTVTVPLYFYFCRNPGLALPLIALQYHEVKCNIEFDSIANSVKAVTTGLSLSSAKLWVDYVYLDTDERRRFAQVSHEYLIEQLQYSEETGAVNSNNFRLNFNHPVKELVWVAQKSASVAAGQLQRFNYTNALDTAFLDTIDGNVGGSFGGGDNLVSDAKLQLNGHDRFATRPGAYFNYVQPYQHHSGSPDEGINVYSFALKPEEHQPSGTCNFSRIDNATLNVGTNAAGTGRVYAVNYNVLRVMSGMGGLAYSN